MKSRLLLFGALLTTGCISKATDNPPFISRSAQTLASQVSTLATGLYNPRGLAFGPDGYLYVAEAGLTGVTTTEKLCPELQAPAEAGGPIKSSMTARISRISPTGTRSTVVDGLPSSETQLGDDQVGVSSVGFGPDSDDEDATLYAVIAGGGCSNGNPDPNMVNGVIRVGPGGTWSYVANLSAYYMTHPVAHPDKSDWTADGVPYDAVIVGHDIYVQEANHGELDRVSLKTGDITRIVDITATHGDIVPTSLAYDGDHLYIGNLGKFPMNPGTQFVMKVGKNGSLQTVVTGLTGVLGIAFKDHWLYVLETSTTGPFPNPDAGRVVRVKFDDDETEGALQTVADKLNYPTAMTFGRDGALYVSANGYNEPVAGSGVVLKIVIPEDR
jgi:hypothetical protein